MIPPVGGDDRLLPETRRACLALVPILGAAWILLWVLPGSTDELWAWPVAPEETAVFMGAAYGAGAFLFARAAAEGRWHALAPVLLPVAAFATLMALATFLHWDRFDHGAPLFYVWIGIYVVSPLVALLWLRNRGADPGPQARAGATVPGPVRAVVGAAGAALTTAGAAFFVEPEPTIEVWPWELTELTARVVASFTVEAGLIAMALARDPRWSAWRLLAQTGALGAALLTVGLLRVA